MSNLQIQSDQNNQIIIKFAEFYDIPVTGVTNMGGKPYVNAAGLMAKAKKIGIKTIKIEIEKAATKEDMSAVVKAIVKLKDGSEYEDIGFGSKESIKMGTLHNPDFITMTTITRAKNRALRSATGFGLVSIEELVTADGMYQNSGSLDSSQTFLDKLDVQKESLQEKTDKESDKLFGEPSNIILGELELKTAEPKKETIDSAMEVFNIEPVKEEKTNSEPKTHQEKLIKELIELVEQTNFNPEPILTYFMANSLNDLLPGQIEYAIKWVKKEALPQK